MRIFGEIRSWSLKIIGYITVVLFGFMTIVGTWQIVSRYVFNKPSTVSEELLTYSFAWMAVLAATYMFGMDEHMRMAFLADKIKGSPRVALAVLSDLLTLAFALIVMVYGGVEITKLTMTQVTASLQIPMGYVYGILPVAGVVISYFSIINLVSRFKGREE